MGKERGRVRGGERERGGGEEEEEWFLFGGLFLSGESALTLTYRAL